MPPELAQLLEECWAPEFTQRPETSQVVDVMMMLVAASYQKKAMGLFSSKPRNKSLTAHVTMPVVAVEDETR